MLVSDVLVVIRGAGDLATGVAYRLKRTGMRILMLEAPEPMAVRRAVSFCEAVYDSETVVEGMRAFLVASPEEAKGHLENPDPTSIPVLVDPRGDSISYLRPHVVVDAIMAKRNLGTTTEMAPVVIGLGPGFIAGRDVHAVIETNRGHDLGKVILNGEAEPDTGVPGMVGGYGIERLIRSPATGTFRAVRHIGDRVKTGDEVGRVIVRSARVTAAEHSVPDGGETSVSVLANISGVLRGLIRDGFEVKEKMKIGDVDPRAERSHCFAISDKARAIGGGVLEAILMLLGRKSTLEVPFPD